MKLRVILLSFAVSAFLTAVFFLHDPCSIQAQPQVASSGSVPYSSEAGVAPRELDFPYYNLTDGFQSTLLLVSDSPKPINFTLAVRSLTGQMLTAPETIQPQEKLSLDLSSLITKLGGDPTGVFAQGSVAVYFIGTIMPIVGQISIRNPQRSLAHESEMVENDPGRSDVPSVLNGLWWGLGGGREAKVMVSNTSNDVALAEVYLDFQGKRHAIQQPFTWTPYETKVFSINQLLLSLGVDPAQAPEGGITIIQAGAHPALIANGKITDPATGFSSTIDFPLPQLERASALHASGIPVGAPSKDSPFAGAGDFIPHVVVRNLLGTAQSVTITVEYPQPAPSVAAMTSSPNTAGGDTGATDSPSSAAAVSLPPTNAHIIPRPPMPGDKTHHPEWGAGTGATMGSMKLASLPVGPYSTADYSLAAVMSQLSLPLPFCSIRIQYSGAPGSLEAEVSSVESKSDLVVDARVENEGNGWAGSGANPWHLDKNSESILFLTNMSDQPARIGFSITAAGIHYYLTQLKLNPHETRAINIRSLRDAQLADFKKSKIPAAANDGSVSWIRIDNVPVMGRLMVIRRGQGVTSSYDCSFCCCSPNPFGLESAPADFDLTALEIISLSGIEEYADCNQQYTYYEITDAAIWTSSDPSVFQMQSTPGEVEALAAGTGTITAQFRAGPFWLCDGGLCVRNTNYIVQHAHSNGTSQVPAYVDPVTVIPDTAQCTPTHNAGRLRIFYQVLDTTKSPIRQANLTVTEQLSWQSSPCATSNGCGQQPTPGTWTTDSTGTITVPDTILNCSNICNSGGNCDENWQQSFQVNGKAVGIYNSSTTGSVDCIATSCNSTPQGTIH